MKAHTPGARWRLRWPWVKDAPPTVLLEVTRAELTYIRAAVGKTNAGLLGVPSAGTDDTYAGLCRAMEKFS
jgi:hypothetical protein